MKTKTFSVNILKAIIVASLIVSCSSDDDNSTNQAPQNDLTALQGEWFRIGGNNPTNDGMKVNVSDDAAAVLNPRQSGFQIGDVKWKGILSENNGVYSYMELGSDYNYYTSEMKFNVDDTLRILVDASGADNIQKWVRQYTIADVDECLPYDPRATDGNFEGEWENINDVNAFSIASVPSDEVNGGIVTATVQTDDPVVPCFNLFAGSDLATGLATGNNGTNTRTYRMVGQPGTLFSGETTDCENAPSEQYPWQYTVSWAYSSIVDCYEPNNAFEQAKAVPKNQGISASGVAGYTEGGLGIYDPSTYDWYKVIICEPTKLRATLSECPSDIHMHFRFFTPNNNGGITNISVSTVEISGAAHDPGSTYYIQSNSVLAPGEYLLEAHRLSVSSNIVADGEPNPAHWSMPYIFTVTTED